MLGNIFTRLHKPKPDAKFGHRQKPIEKLTATLYCNIAEPSVYMLGDSIGLRDQLSKFDVTLLDPKRSMDWQNVYQAQDQIEWEHAYLSRCSGVVCWIPATAVSAAEMLDIAVSLDRAVQAGKKVIVGVAAAREDRDRMKQRLESHLKTYVYESLYDVMEAAGIWLDGWSLQNGDKR